MDEKKDGFVIYSSYAEKFEDLTDEQFGRLMRIVCEYEKSGETPRIEDKSIRIAFKVIKYELDANGQKYEEICEKRKKAIQARWEKKTESGENTNDTKVYKSIQADRRVPADWGQESQASSWVEAWNSACLSRCPRGERPLVGLYLEPGVFFRTMHGKTAPSC